MCKQGSRQVAKKCCIEVFRCSVEICPALPLAHPIQTGSSSSHPFQAGSCSARHWSAAPGPAHTSSVSSPQPILSKSIHPALFTGQLYIAQLILALFPAPSPSYPSNPALVTGQPNLAQLRLALFPVPSPSFPSQFIQLSPLVSRT